jgi:hypothetical protein
VIQLADSLDGFLQLAVIAQPLDKEMAKKIMNNCP